MSEPEVLDRRPRRGGRWFIGCAGAVVVLLILLVGLDAHFRHRAERQLREAIDALDQKDPRWRLDDIETDRARIPDAENAALVILSIRRQLLPPAGEPPRVELPGKGVDPPHRLRAATAVQLKAELEKYPAAIAKARTLADLDHGCYPITYSSDIISTDQPHLNHPRAVAWLLTADAYQRAEQGDVDGALRSARAAVVSGRSFGDEPFWLSQTVRTACVAMGTRAAERALNQGEASDEELAAVQLLWRKEDRVNLRRLVARGARARFHEAVSRLYRGEPSLDELYGTTTADLQPRFGRDAWLRIEHTQGLEMLTRAVEITELPPHQQGEPVEALDREFGLRPQGPSRMLRQLLGLHLLEALTHWTQRHQASVRSLTVLVAAERYRRANGRWPESVTALVPVYFGAVPLDPYDGEPVRMKRTPFGIVVYCVGRDGKDDGGRIDLEAREEPGTDVGHRLWDVSKRRQPAPPPPPALPLVEPQ